MAKGGNKDDSEFGEASGMIPSTEIQRGSRGDRRTKIRQIGGTIGKRYFV